jgi:hypothetical protein
MITEGFFLTSFPSCVFDSSGPYVMKLFLSSIGKEHLTVNDKT